MKAIKAHAYGNDFLLIRSADVPAGNDRPGLVRAACDRHTGLGADGVLFVDEGPDGAAMALLNADGSPSEVSGNGVRCIAAWLARNRRLSPGARLIIETGAGPKALTLIAEEDGRFTFRASMGQPTELARVTLKVRDELIDTVTMRVGNPQCVVLGPATPERLGTIGRDLATHPHFAEGTNVELAELESPDRVRILIWERGVGPTSSSGTGTCAAAVAAVTFGGASRTLDVVAPGGTQRVEWNADGLWLTGWATVVAEMDWLIG